MDLFYMIKTSVMKELNSMHMKVLDQAGKGAGGVEDNAWGSK